MAAQHFNDRNFREKYRGKKPLNPQLPQKHLAAPKHKKTGASSQDILGKVFIYRGSIVDDELTNDIDAVVNPANERLWADGSGVCDAIFKAAGYSKLQKACTAITDKTDDNRIPTGQTVITNGFDLNVSYILHTTAPFEQNNEDLISCYISALELCVIKGIRSVAFPCIGTGDGHFSKQSACSIALRSVRGWLSDAANVKFKDFMQKVETKQSHDNKNDNKNEEKKENDDDIFIDQDETVSDRILNVVFCCFDQENWDLYKTIMPKIYPSSNPKHSYLWIDRVRTIEYENEITNMLQQIHCLEIENKQLKTGAENEETKENQQDDDDEEEEETNGIKKAYIILNEEMEEFKQQYTEEQISEIIEKCPQKLISTKRDVINNLHNLKKIKETTDSFIEYVEDINVFISKISIPNTQQYKQWNVEEIILWIMSLENGKFTEYVDQLRAGFISSEIMFGETLPELTRSDLSVPPFSINSFKIKKDLIAHFQSLKDNEGYNTTN